MRRTPWFLGLWMSTAAVAQDVPRLELSLADPGMERPPLAVMDGPRSLETTRRVRAMRLRKAGIVTTAMGLGLASMGGAFFVAGATADCPEFECWTGAILTGMGGVAVLSSLPFLVSGGAMWGVGQRRLDRPRLSVAVAPGLRRDGAAIGMHVTW